MFLPLFKEVIRFIVVEVFQHAALNYKIFDFALRSCSAALNLRIHERESALPSDLWRHSPAFSERYFVSDIQLPMHARRDQILCSVESENCFKIFKLRCAVQISIQINPFFCSINVGIRDIGIRN